MNLRAHIQASLRDSAERAVIEFCPLAARPLYKRRSHHVEPAA